MRVAVIGRGSAGSLAAAHLSFRLPEDTLCHIYDSRAPTIGVGEGTQIGMVHQLRLLTGLDDATIQERLRATRKYGIHFEGWGATNREFVHHFFPVGRAYGYHLSAETLGELLSGKGGVRRVDACVTRLSRVADGCEVEFDRLPAERFDLVFDARGFPRQLDAKEHMEVSCIPTNTAIIRRGPATARDADHTYTRSVARPHGWVFVIPLTVHTSYGYVFNRHIASVEEAAGDFDAFLQEECVEAFEPRGTIPFPNFIHRHMYDGFVARIGNAAGFMEPLEATALTLIQAQIGTILDYRLSRPSQRVVADAAVINKFLVRFAWRLGVFISWHYSRGSIYETAFWRHARDEAWPRHQDTGLDRSIDLAAEVRLFNRFVEVGREGGARAAAFRKAYAAFKSDSFIELARGLGLSE